MAFDGYVKIDLISGESKDKDHQDWIEIINYSFDISQKISTAASSSGGASAERADFKEFEISKYIDLASPLLYFACANGTHIDKITVELYRASGSSRIKFMEYEMTDCLISSVITSSSDDFPYEKIKINYGKIEWSYALQKRDTGLVMGNIAAGWDLERNCKI